MRILEDEVSAEITSIYDQQIPFQPRKLRPAVQILKSKFAGFVNNKVTFLGEFPSLDLEDTKPSVLNNNLTYKLDY